MIPSLKLLIYWAALPAILLGLWLFHVTDVPRSVQVLQVVAAAAGSVVFFAAARVRRLTAPASAEWLALALALSLFIPLLADRHGGPERWIHVGSFRLYLAPVVLPVLLFMLGTLPLRATVWHAGTVIAVALALVLQPDACQLTAFAVGVLALAASGTQLMLRVGLLAVLAIGAVITWHLPDPIPPVRHVEGVFVVAEQLSLLALVAALASAALPVAALTWVAWSTRSVGPLAVAAYYATLYAQAPLLLTPVPLLGFGVGPILGYFLVAGMISRGRTAS